MAAITNLLYRVSLISCCLLFFITSSAQSVPEKTFILEEDNKQVQINVLFKDHPGYIYVGSNDGLYKFDGIKFYRILFDNKDYKDTVTAIYQDKKEKFWVGFKSGRIANVRNGKLVYYNPEEGTPAKKITAFLEDLHEKIWFSTAGEGIYYINKGRIFLVNQENGLTDENVSALALSSKGDILAATDQGINCIHINESNRITSFGPKQGLPDYIVTAIIPAAGNSFWLGMQDKGFCSYNHNTGKITSPVTEPWTHGQVNALLQAQGFLWIASQDGLFKLRLSDGNTLSPSGNAENINNLLEDDQANIWLTDPATGLIRTAGESLKVYPLPAGTLFEHIHVLLADKKENLWLTNFENELIKTPLYPGGQSDKIHLEGINEKTDITALYQDNFENIWIGTMGHGIYILNPHTKQYRLFTENAVFKDASILSITGKGNTVFASSLQGSMQVILAANNKDIHSMYDYSNFDQAGMASNYIYTIFKDSRERTWFATDGKGISVLKNGIFINYDSQEEIKDDRVYSITEDRKGNIWFSTATAGIYKFDGKQFTNYSIRQGLSDLNISAVKTDKRGNIIIIHKNGLDILDPVTGNISYVNNNRGISMLNVEDLGATAQDSSGNIYVSSEHGIISYSPEVNIVRQPKTIIESVQLFLNHLSDSASHSFSHEDNNFTFNYTGLYYTDPGEVYYQYKLDGFDSSWVLTSDRSKTFPKLAPGKYTFRIQSSLNKSFINADEASYTFVIRQAFYKKWWFLLGSILLISGFLYWYIKNRETRLKNMERLRQEKIQFRFEVLRNQVNPHFLFNSFNTLISTIEEDPKLAVEYVEQLSDFFRNIVNYRDKEVISFKEEMELLYTYLFLQKKRYGDNLQLTILINEPEIYFIPPLTLQLLMENAVKHNAITKDAPLMITIEETDGQYLTIKNNINPRRTKEAGSGMGLQNIIARYHLLTSKEVKISHTERYFIVSLPLITMHHA